MISKTYEPEFLKASCGILSGLYAIIGFFPLLWGYPFKTTTDLSYIVLFFGPFILMSASLFIITRHEVNFLPGAIVGVLTFSAVLLLIVSEKLFVNAIILLFYAILYATYYLRSYSIGAVHDAELRGMDSIFEATSEKIIYSPLFMLILLLLSLAG